jgi:hypothetical protein
MPLVIMQGVPCDVIPSAPVEAKAEPFWRLQRQLSPKTMSTMRTVPELSLDVSGAKGADARDGIYGRVVYDVGQRGQAGTDAGTAMAGANAGRVVLYMSTFVVGEANHSEDSATVNNGGYRGSILAQYTISNATSSTTTTYKSVLLVPQVHQPETRSCCPSILSCSTIKILAVGGMGGNGGVGGNGSGGTQGGRGEVSTCNHIVADFCHFLRVQVSFPFSCLYLIFP